MLKQQMLAIVDLPLDLFATGSVDRHGVAELLGEPQKDRVVRLPFRTELPAGDLDRAAPQSCRDTCDH